MPKLRKISQDEYDQTPEDDADLSDDAATAPARYPDERYPYLAAWVEERGWIEIGADHYSSSAVRILDEGGMVWESQQRYESFEATLAAADAALAELEAEGMI